MSYLKEMEGASFEQLFRWWSSDEVPNWGESRDTFFSELACALVQNDEQGVSFLKRYTKDENVAKRKAALWFLADKRIIDDEIIEAISEAFRSGNQDLKTTAIWYYINAERFELKEQTVEQLFHDADERMSALAMVYLTRAHPDQRVEMLREALASENPRMREYACDEVGDFDIEELKGRLAELVNDPHSEVREAAKANLGLWDE